MMIMMVVVKTTWQDFNTDDQDIDNKIVSFSLWLPKVEMLRHTQTQVFTPCNDSRLSPKTES